MLRAPITRRSRVLIYLENGTTEAGPTKNGDEMQNDRPAGLATTASSGKGRAALAVILILVGVLLTPIAVLGSWARLQLVDTDHFVQTFAPLADDPAVQSFIADQATQAVERSIDIDAYTSDFFAGVTNLGLPSSAQASIPLLEAAMAQGMRSLISTTARHVVESPQFAALWEQTLRQTHSRTIAVIQGDPNAVLQLTNEGVISLDLNVVIVSMKQYLTQQGVRVAALIPEVNWSIPLLASGSLVQVRVVYQLAATVGLWLPWIAIGLLVGGVAAARNRPRALIWAAGGVAVSLLLLSALLSLGKQLFVIMVAPSVMPVATADAIAQQLTLLLTSVMLTLIVLSLIVVIAAWFAGSSPSAQFTRAASGKVFARLRDEADQRGIGTGKFGRLVERWYSVLLTLTVVVGLLVLFTARPIQLGGVATTLLSMFIVLVALQLIRRPAADADAVSR